MLPVIRRNSFLQKVIQCMETISPLYLADKSFDNVGLLVESPISPFIQGNYLNDDSNINNNKNNNNKNEKIYDDSNSNILLTIDLTLSVLQESIEKKCSIIIAYHPPIFTPFKSLNLKNVKDSIIIQCISHGISIYSPHTSLDATKDGINDWIASSIGKGLIKAIQPYQNESGHIMDECVGAGRILTLTEPKTISNILHSLKKLFGIPTARLALAPVHSTSSSLVKTIAICAGSGGSLFQTVKGPVDLFVTGEMSHHQILAAVAANASVLLFEHSNTERGYLSDLLKEKLSSSLIHLHHLDPKSFNIFISKSDRDPLQCI